MQTLTEIRALLAARGVEPRHAFGQNFLHDHNILRKILDAAAVEPGETILEIGPGTGALTECLLERGARVIAAEIDRTMVAILESRVRPLAPDRLEIVAGDALDGKRALAPALRERLPGPFRLVANLPYGSATPLIATLLAAHPECRGQLVTIQREVADRLAAGPGTDAYGPLSVTTALLGEVRRLADIPPGAFWPAPEVTSSLVSITRRPDDAIPPELRDPDGARDFERFVGEIFSKRRKQLGSILGRSAALPPGVRAEDRPEVVSPESFLELRRLAQPPDSLRR